ncbi:1-phosphofructokinase family hexose kinase [Mycoplasma marinum]|uniref:Carbohydrate kinase PfkB domain-containing protein n=1 Tax=Mycoplasma marinum TaxID=1937190 RepID=A0A4R0XK19_9MOLU|nr:hexose kinase [Mycoplasma marinum]TCG10983.1 hypothetical protein C4B24_03410 [Mycoplasma marinum]
MHYTLTLNPAVDYFMNFQDEISNHQKTDSFELMPGGKGINASIILNNLGIENKTIFLAGGMIGKQLEVLVKSKGVGYIKVDSGVNTRINVKASFEDTYEMNVSGEPIKFEQVKSELFGILDTMDKQDTLLVMGSLPNGFTFKDLETIIQRAFNNEVKLVFDLSKDHLTKLTKYRPEVIKPNRKELEELFNCSIKTKEESFKYAEKLIKSGAKRVLVSFDKSGSIYIDENKNKRIINGVTIQEVNGSGAGDSMISAFVAGISQEFSVNEALKLASAAGTATASVAGIATKKEIMDYKNKILIKER